MQINPYMLDFPTPPYIDIFPDEVTYDIAGSRGGDENVMIVRAAVGLTLDVAAQVKLDRLLASSGASSVKEALENEDGSGDGRVTLGGKCDDARVTRCTGYQAYPKADGTAVLAAQWSVQVETSG